MIKEKWFVYYKVGPIFMVFYNHIAVTKMCQDQPRSKLY